MKLKNVFIYQLDGTTPAPANEDISGHGDALTLARVLTHAALSPDSRGMAVPSEEAAARYDLATKLYGTSIEQFFEVSNSLLQKLTSDVCRLYAPLVSGQFVKIVENAKADPDATIVKKDDRV